MVLSLWRRAMAARDRKRDIATLHSFDDELLRDLGLTRDQIPDYVAGRLPQQRPERPMLRLVVDQTPPAKAPAAQCCAPAA